MSFKILSRLALLGATTMALIGSALAYTGAIYTTWPDGLTVNGNIYDSKDHVYLNGGPQNMNANGLPEGTYYFQITDPSGKVLLSSDPASDRKLIVVNNASGHGVVAGNDHGGGAPHMNGAFNAANGSTGVQMIPYDDTPNPGGEYKAWLIPVDKATIDGDGKHLLFANRDAKTDNFKVRTDGGGGDQPSTIQIFKFYDSNGDGNFDFAQDPPINGFRFHLIYTAPNGQLVDTIAYTGPPGYPNGEITFDTKPNTPYTVTEVLPTTVGATWHQSLPNVNALGSDGFPDGSGLYGYMGITPGPGGNKYDPFGNYAMANPSGGLTLGFWHNKNGEKLMTGSTNGQVLNATAVAALGGKNLVNGAGVQVAPFANFSAFSNWIVGANASNMANMLSAQLAAMELNCTLGGSHSSSVVFVPEGDNTQGGTSIGQVLFDGDGFGHSANIHPVVGGWTITIGDLMDASVTSLGANPVTTASGSVRTYQDCLKTLLDQLNNNGGAGGGGLGFILPPIPLFSYPPIIPPGTLPAPGTLAPPPL